MEISSTQKIFYGHVANISRERCRLSKAERARRSREMFWRKGSKILPDYFPPDLHKSKTFCHQTAISFKRKGGLVKQYSWEKEENGQFEAQTIAESWMMYFGIEARDSWHSSCQYRWLFPLYNCLHFPTGAENVLVRAERTTITTLHLEWNISKPLSLT